MPFKPYVPPIRTNIRERMLVSRLARADETEQSLLRALQDAEALGLSPGEIDATSSLLGNVRRFKDAFSDELDFVRKQDASLTKAEEILRAEREDDPVPTPLRPTRERSGFHRSEQERNAAMLGILERERRQNAPLTREAFTRAQSIDANRSKYVKDPHFTGLNNAVIYGGYVVKQSDFVDPCVEYLRQQKIRREVLFARGLAFGSRSRKRQRSPC